jgi:hypothetical protein
MTDHNAQTEGAGNDLPAVDGLNGNMRKTPIPRDRRTVFARRNPIKDFFISMFSFLGSPCCLLLEVFIRKDFGERYFKLSSAIVVALLVGAIPLLSLTEMGSFNPDEFMGGGDEEYPMRRNVSFLVEWFSWYAFLAAFLFMSFKHYRDQLTAPSVFKAQKYSLYTGRHSGFFKGLLHKAGPLNKASHRTVETVIEPVFFLVIGLVLWKFLGQNVGVLIMICSLIYSLSYVARYDEADNFMMDKLDNIIISRELQNVLINELVPENAGYVESRGRLPKDINIRQQIFEQIKKEQDLEGVDIA